MRARTVVVVAMQSAITVTLAAIALAWAGELSDDRARYEHAQAEWQAASVALELAQHPDGLAREHRPDLELRRLADEEAARGEAALVRQCELSAMRDEVRQRVAALDSHTRDLAARQEVLRREAEASLDSELRAHEVATWTRDAAVAFRNRAFNDLREVERDVAEAGTSMAATRARIVQWTEDIRAHERLLEQAEKAGVPLSQIAEWPVPVPHRVPVGIVARVDLAALLVLIDVGRVDGITEGTRFEVRRDERLICEVEVKTVHDDNATAGIIAETLGEGRSPQVGDRVLRVRLVVRGRLDGTVERVDLGVLLMDIDVGGDDGAVCGMTFTVYRGDKYICKVQIKTVGEHSSSAWILVETMVQGRAPTRGDRVKNHD